MQFKIKTDPLEEGGYMATIDWDYGDAGQVGTPGAVRYAATEPEAYLKLYEYLKEIGHEIIE